MSQLEVLSQLHLRAMQRVDECKMELVRRQEREASQERSRLHLAQMEAQMEAQRQQMQMQMQHARAQQ
jgi:hypothetical protein